MGKTLGIDLGTTNCCVCVMEAGSPRVVPNREGSRTTPSVVAFTESSERLIGHIAKRQAVTNPKNTVYAMKRLIGQKFDTATITSAREHLAYEIVPASNGDAWVKCHDQTYSPQEISGIILRELKEAAEEQLGETISEAVITVPAYFDDAQRQATKDAGTIAGLTVKRIINEPTAAALAYGMESGFNGRIAVYDMGGGTFDVSILEVAGGVFEVRATAGDSFLGGEDFDNAIIRWMIDKFQEETGINLRFDKMALQRLKEAAEKAKCELSAVEISEISLPFISSDAAGAKHLNLKLDRPTFNDLVRDLVERSKHPCLEAMESAEMGPAEIDRVLLVGGQTRTPLIQEMVTGIFGKDPCMDLNPDEVVGIGAAIQGSVLKGEVKDIVLLDVTPLSLGIETQGGLMYRMIEKNANIPTSYSQTFTTVADDQAAVGIHVLQGESDISANNRSLGKFDLVDIPPAKRGTPQIEVTFEIDSNGIVVVSAMNTENKKAQSMNITPSSGLTPSEIDEIISRAERNKEADEHRKGVIKKKNKLESMVRSMERSFKEYGTQISPDETSNIHEALNGARQAIADDDEAKIDSAVEELSQLSALVSEVIMLNTGNMGRTLE